MIRITHKGRVIECSSASEAIAMLKHFDEEDNAPVSGSNKYLSFSSAVQDIFGRAKNAWSRESFWKFVESLGESQIEVLRILVQKQRVSDQELRKALKLDNNKALAGVLSGISKQAAALNVPARAVYAVEDERREGELIKTYAVAIDFLGMAKEMNWTGE